MATPLDSGTKTQIRLYLGWPQRFRQSDSRLEQALNYMDTDSDLQAVVSGSLLTQLKNIDSNLTNAYLRLQFDKAGDTETNRQEIAWLRSEGRRLVGRMASILSIPVIHDVYEDGASNVQTPGRGSLGGTHGGWMKVG